jgi:FkbM family methyltransferase
MRNITMLPFAKHLIKKTINRLGYDIRRSKIPSPFSYDIWPWIRSTQNIRTVIDIGANNGDFLDFLVAYFKPIETYAFEPLVAFEATLRAKAALIPNCQVFSLALSDHSGRESLYENSYLPATSLLRVSEASKTEFPQTVGEIAKSVQVSPLDDVLDAGSLEKNVLIKIDVQGLEDRVIRGGEKVFSVAQCVHIEMSFVPMYDGQPLFEEVHSLLVRLGFRFSGIKNQIDSVHSGQPLFAHCLYIRSDNR